MLRLSLMKMLHKDFGGPRDLRPGENGALVNKSGQKKESAKESKLSGDDLIQKLPESIWHNILMMTITGASLAAASSTSITSSLSSSASSSSLPSHRSAGLKPGSVSIRASELTALRSIAITSKRFNALVRGALSKCVGRLSIDVCNDPATLVSMAVSACTSAKLHCTINAPGRHMCTDACLHKFMEIGARVSELSMNTGVAADECFHHQKWVKMLRAMAKTNVSLPLVKSVRLRGYHTHSMFSGLAEIIPDTSLRDLALIGVEETGKKPATVAQKKEEDVRNLSQVLKYTDNVVSLHVSEATFRAFPKAFQALYSVRNLDLTRVVDADTATGVPITQDGIMRLIHNLPDLQVLNIAAGSNHSSPGRHTHRLHLLEIPSLVEVTIGVYRLGGEDPPTKFLQSLDDTARNREPLSLRKVNIVFRDLPSRSPQQFRTTMSQSVKRARDRTIRTRGGGGSMDEKSGTPMGGGWGRNWGDIAALGHRTGITFRAINLFNEELHRWKSPESSTASVSS